MQLRLFYELVIENGQSDAPMQDSPRCEQLRKIVSEALPEAAGDGSTPPGQVTGSRSAFVVGNNNTVVINLVLPKEGAGGGP